MPFNKDKYTAALVGLAKLDIIVYGPRVLILRDDSEEMTKGGLIIPEGSRKTKKTGTVVALGQGFEEVSEEVHATGVAIGHRVMFNAYDGVEQSIDTDMGMLPVVTMHVGNLYMGWKNREVQ